MTTAQESTNGHHSYPPLSVENPELNRAELPTNKANNNQFPANAYHVPPKPFTPNPKLDQPNDYSERAKRLGPLPERCQFMFSDGRQCTMARSDIHPSLCVYHSDREEQLFGDPSCRCEARTLDFPELYSACRDLITAAGVNRALGQVFRLLAQRRISRQEAATFAKLGHLLLQSISAARSSRESDDATSIGIPSEYRERRIAQNTSHSVLPIPPREHSPEPTSSHKNGNCSPHPVPSVNSSASQGPPETSLPPLAGHNTTGINTSATSVCNSREINTSENAELKTLQNEHLKKNGGGQVTGRMVAQSATARDASTSYE